MAQHDDGEVYNPPRLRHTDRHCENEERLVMSLLAFLDYAGVAVFAATGQRIRKMPLGKNLKA